MSSANTGEFLVEVEEKDAFVVLHNCFTNGSELVLKNEADAHPLSAKISFFADKKVFLEAHDSDRALSFTQGLTNIKFFIGTEVYFIKTALEFSEDGLCFDQTAKIIQLRRRKEPRYNIPDKWNQTAAVWSIELKLKNEAKVIDISSSGIRFEIPKLTIDVAKGNTIRIQYQIFKRAEVVCDAIVRFVMKKPNGSVVLGMEFTQLQKSHRSRVNSIVEDLENHLATKLAAT